MRVVHYVCAICHHDYGGTKTAKKKAAACEKRGRPEFLYRVRQKFLDSNGKTLVITKRKVRLGVQGKHHRVVHVADFKVRYESGGFMGWVRTSKIDEWRVAS